MSSRRNHQPNNLLVSAVFEYFQSSNPTNVSDGRVLALGGVAELGLGPSLITF
jgi:hypothetical protein